MILRNGRILLLDEPANGPDQRSEFHITPLSRKVSTAGQPSWQHRYGRLRTKGHTCLPLDLWNANSCHILMPKSIRTQVIC